MSVRRLRQDRRFSRFGSSRNWIAAGVLLAALPAVAQDSRRPTPEALAHPGPGSREGQLAACQSDTARDAHGADRPAAEVKSICDVDKIASPAERRRMQAYVDSYVRKEDIVRTIKLPSGDIVDCVDMYKQPAMRSAAMKGQRLQLLPSKATLATDRAPLGDGRVRGKFGPDPKGASEARPPKQEYGGESEVCPEKSVPIQRITLETLKNFRTLDDFFRKTPPKKGPTGLHQYAHAYRVIDNRGAQSIFNVWGPYTNRSDEFSLSQIWVVRGSGANLETVEAGWQKFRDLYGDYRPRLFIYFTPDNYGSGGCYNLSCNAFVQVNNSVYIGGGFTNISQHPHPSTAWEFKLRWQKDGPEGHWWLKYGDTWVGYYPRTKFDSNGLRSQASEVDFGGEIIDRQTGGVHTSTDMGSGHFPGDGFGFAAYQRQIRYITPGNVWGTYPSLTDTRSDKDCYDIKVNSSSGGWERYFYFGGPGFNSNCE